MSRTDSDRPHRLGAAEVSSRWQDSQKLLELQPTPRLPHDCFAGCEPQHRQTAFAKRKRHDAVFRVNQLLELQPTPRLLD